MSASKDRGRLSKNESKKAETVAARPVSDDGSPVAIAPTPMAPGAIGLFSRRGIDFVPAREDVSPRFFGAQHTFENRVKRGLGWLPDMPDFRDMTLDHMPKHVALQADATEAFRRVRGTIGEVGPASLPILADNREFCSPIEDQGQLGSCTANACIGMVEYMQRRSGMQHIDGSRLFLYKATRKLLGWAGDTGAFLRTTMKALVHFGIPPEEVWPYEVSTFDQEPDPFMYAYASNTKAISYLRLDPPGRSSEDTLHDIKSTVSRGYAVMFGFSVYSSLSISADIPFPGPADRLNGGHAVLIVGYDDRHECLNGLPGSTRKGALLIRNSWGQGWGDDGYGWLPYDYVRSGLANDFWTCFQLAWVETGRFD